MDDHMPDLGDELELDPGCWHALSVEAVTFMLAMAGFTAEEIIS
jgi:hypothetical protein